MVRVMLDEHYSHARSVADTMGTMSMRSQRPSKEFIVRYVRRLRHIPVFVALFVLTSFAHADLRSDIEQAMRSSSLQNASIGISVRDADTGRSLYAHNASDRFIPASNMKLLTSGAALHVLGPAFEFRTRLVQRGQDLVIVGDGDPGFGDPVLLQLMQFGEFDGIDVETFLGIWADAVEQAGISRVNNVIVDDRMFDRVFVHSTWPVDQLNRWYCAEVCGFNFHLNVLHFYPRPVPGARPDISNVQPRAPWLHPTNRGTSRTGPKDQPTVWIARAASSNAMTVFGNVKHAYGEDNPVRVTVHDMPTFFAQLFADRLERAGVSVAGHRAARSDDAVFNPDDMAGSESIVGPVIATPISTAVTRCNRDSQNMYAEALLKRIGREMTGEPGSWINGSAIVRHVMLERIDDASLASRAVIRDGSGMSRHNSVAPATLTAWLNSFHQDSTLGDMFINSLAEPGSTGTLRRRFDDQDLHGAAVRAKSGYINQVSCLSGFVTMPDGRRRSFSILCNDVQSSATRHARTLQEEVVAAIARDMAQQPSPAVSLGSD